MKSIRKISFLFTLFIGMLSCNGQVDKNAIVKNKMNQEFRSYWYEGKAEITSYELDQARYGESRDGEVILVFVTEDFLTEKQVKKESNTREEDRSVLKLNFIRKFPTGIYDYSMMTSIYTPINQSAFCQPMKLSTSSQEWCGHSWLQLNQKEASSYQLRSYSYFEAEGDVEVKLNTSILEEGLWTQLRINPDLIQVGEQEIFPSTHYLRFAHKALKPYKAVVTKVANNDRYFEGKNLQALSIFYPELDRSIYIAYEAAFPHEIIGWKEIYKSWGQEMKTLARKKAQLKSAYWGQNGVKDASLRDELKLK